MVGDTDREHIFIGFRCDHIASITVVYGTVILTDVHMNFVYSDGDKYDGDWKNDERHGHGIMTYCGENDSVQEKYEGEWVEGRMQGK